MANPVRWKRINSGIAQEPSAASGHRNPQSKNGLQFSSEVFENFAKKSFVIEVGFDCSFSGFRSLLNYRDFEFISHFISLLRCRTFLNEPVFNIYIEIFCSLYKCSKTNENWFYLISSTLFRQMSGSLSCCIKI